MVQKSDNKKVRISDDIMLSLQKCKEKESAIGSMTSYIENILKHYVEGGLVQRKLIQERIDRDTNLFKELKGYFDQISEVNIQLVEIVKTLKSPQSLPLPSPKQKPSTTKVIDLRHRKNPPPLRHQKSAG